MNSSVVAEPLTVGEDGNPWTGAVTLEVTDAEGQAQTWPLQVADAPEGAVTLDNEATSTAYWTLVPDQTVELAEGDYAVTATLDAASFESGWQGSARSRTAFLHVSKAPESLSAEQESLLAQRLAAQAVLVGDSEGAMAILDELLAEQPDSIGALEFKGNLLADEGRTEEAFQAYSQAIRAFYEQNENPDEPPAMLAHKQHEMMVKLLEK
jgi:tetratricopeptide (TPR) repeat protein